MRHVAHHRRAKADVGFARLGQRRHEEAILDGHPALSARNIHGGGLGDALGAALAATAAGRTGQIALERLLFAMVERLGLFKRGTGGHRIDGEDIVLRAAHRHAAKRKLVRRRRHGLGELFRQLEAESFLERDAARDGRMAEHDKIFAAILDLVIGIRLEPRTTLQRQRRRSGEIERQGRIVGTDRSRILRIAKERGRLDGSAARSQRNGNLGIGEHDQLLGHARHVRGLRAFKGLRVIRGIKAVKGFRGIKGFNVVSGA